MSELKYKNELSSLRKKIEHLRERRFRLMFVLRYGYKKTIKEIAGIYGARKQYVSRELKRKKAP